MLLTAVSVRIIHNGTPTAGENYNLTCSVPPMANTITYKWKNNGKPLSETGPTLSLMPLRLSNAGTFMCEATVENVTVLTTTNLTIKSLLNC